MKSYNICILHPNDNVYSETFIRAHIRRLPGHIFELYGGWFPVIQRKTGKKYIKKPFIFIDKGLSQLLNKNIVFFRGKAFREYLIMNKIDAVLAEYGQTGATVESVFKTVNIPLIVHFHGGDAYCTDVLAKYLKQYQQLFTTAKAIIAVSNDMYHQLIHLGAPENKVILNSCSVDMEIFKQTRPDKNPPVFIAVGRFADKKAPHLTIEAFRSVLQSVPEAKLIMIGDGPLFNMCKSLVEKYGMAESVILTGPLSHDNVKEKMQTARAFVQHSVRPANGDSEGTPVVILEASACGLPVISTKHAGIKDAVEDNVTGFLSEEGDVDHMSASMIKIALNPSLAFEMGNAGRIKMMKEYNMPQHIMALFKIIENAITGS